MQNRFQSVLNTFRLGKFKVKVNLSLDFGSSRTRLMWGEKLIWNQPTLVAYHNRLQSVVAIGQHAADLRGKTGTEVEILSPIKKGVIVNLQLAELYLSGMLEELQKKELLPNYLRAECQAALPTLASPRERAQFKQVLSQVGLKLVNIVSPAESIAHLSNIKNAAQTHAILDLGAEKVELGVFSGQEAIMRQTLTALAGKNFTKAIIEEVAKKTQLRIGYQTGLELKKKLGLALRQGQTSQVEVVKGQDLQKKTLKVVKVDLLEFTPVLTKLALFLLKEVSLNLDGLSPELGINLQEQGMYVSGGESQLLNWEELIKEELNLKAIISPHPELEVVTGLVQR